MFCTTCKQSVSTYHAPICESCNHLIASSTPNASASAMLGSLISLWKSFNKLPSVVSQAGSYAVAVLVRIVSHIHITFHCSSWWFSPFMTVIRCTVSCLVCVSLPSFIPVAPHIACTSDNLKYYRGLIIPAYLVSPPPNCPKQHSNLGHSVAIKFSQHFEKHRYKPSHVYHKTMDLLPTLSFHPHIFHRTTSEKTVPLVLFVGITVREFVTARNSFLCKSSTDRKASSQSSP